MKQRPKDAQAAKSQGKRNKPEAWLSLGSQRHESQPDSLETSTLLPWTQYDGPCQQQRAPCQRCRGPFPKGVPRLLWLSLQGARSLEADVCCLAAVAIDELMGLGYDRCVDEGTCHACSGSACGNGWRQKAWNGETALRILLNVKVICTNCAYSPSSYCSSSRWMCLLAP